MDELNPTRAANFLAFMGYARAEIIAALLDQFPGCDAEALTDTALDRETERAKTTDNMIAQYDRAIAAEHDLGESNGGNA